MSKPDFVAGLKNVSEKDRRQIEQATEMLGPDPEELGLVKSIFWGALRGELVVPYPEVEAAEAERCDALLGRLDRYLREEHPAHRIDRDQEIPPAVIERLFELGVLGMIVPQEYGGGGFGITSYNRVLARIGETCGSTAVLVSAHLSIGCGALMLFGSDEQKQRYLPRMATDTLSAFCLSEPNVGCDAAGQETRCELSGDGEHYILNGEKKWATSGALAGLFTVMAKQKLVDPKSGKEREGVTALICTPDLPGIDIFSRNRSKCGIRGTWQARIRFTDVKVPKSRLLHREGKGLNVALSCLNIGRCTLSAGMLGAARAATRQATKWAKYRYQFDRPIGEFELVQEKVAAMAAYCYAMDAMLYMTTGFIDRDDDDIMLETALCKVFCSEMGFRSVDHALQIMGGEGYMTENEVEKLWRDSRINTIVEGANEVMHSFVFAYGSKQLGEYLLSLRDNPLRHPAAALRLGAELFLGLRRRAPRIEGLAPQLAPLQRQLERQVRDFSHEVKLALKRHREQLITMQLAQRRLSWCALWIHAMACSLARLDKSVRDGVRGAELEDERRLVDYIFDRASDAIERYYRELRHNTDDRMRVAAQAAMRRAEAVPDSEVFIPEATPDAAARGAGRVPDQTDIPQFGSGSKVREEEVAVAPARKT